MDAARTLRERFQGALVGLAVGDALAAHTQFRKPGSFAAVGDLLGGGPFDQPRGAWTDDTAMALLLAESLLEREGFDAHDQVQRFVRWQREGYGSATGQCVGISANVARALATAQYKRQPFAGSHDPEQLDKDPLSRIAPVVMYFFADAPTAVAKAAEVGAHHRAGAHGSRLRAPAGRHDPPGACRAATRPRSCTRRESCGRRPARGRRCWRSTTAHTRSRMPPDITGGGGILQALEAALWAFNAPETFREGALLAANLGPRLGCGGRGLWPDRRRLSRCECDSGNLA